MASNCVTFKLITCKLSNLSNSHPECILNVPQVTLSCVYSYITIISLINSQLFANRGCHVVSVTDPYGRILGFLDRETYCFFQVAPQLHSRGCVDPVLDPLLLRKSGSARNRTRTSGSVARNPDNYKKVGTNFADKW
jgi:hypothetical protein